jgi:hypothetical protein
MTVAQSAQTLLMELGIGTKAGCNAQLLPVAACATPLKIKQLTILSAS